MDIVIKEAQSNDTEKLLDFARKNFIATYAHLNTPENMRHYLELNFTREAYEKEIAHPDSYFFIARKSQEIVGYFKLNFGSAQTEPGHHKGCEIERIYVAESTKGKGLGRKMFEHAKTYGASKGAGYLWLGVWEHNTNALTFYQRMGMEPFGTHVFRLGDEAQTDIMMKIDLGQ